MKKLICIIGGAMFLLNAFSQNVKSLEVGDTMPNLPLSHIVNITATPKYLYDVDKPIILDFFGTHCGACISLLPYMNKIQKQSKDSLSIFIVAYESADVINRFLGRNPKAQGLSLPFITGDTLLGKLFKHRGIPHEIWIGRDHVIKAISSDIYVNQNNIQKFISGAPLHLPVKDDFVEYDPVKSFGEYQQIKRLKFSSSLWGYTDNLLQNFYKSIYLSDSLNKKLIFFNCDVRDIIQKLRLPHPRYASNRFILNVRDSSHILPINKKITDHWFFNNSYCYELTVPRAMPDSVIKRYVLNDIGRFLKLTIEFRKVKMPCYVLTQAGNRIKDPTARGGERTVEYRPQPGNPVTIRNAPISSLMMAMNAGSFSHPSPIVLDETGIKGNVDMTFHISGVKNLKEIDGALRRYGLKLTKTKRIVDMVVISDL